VTCRFLQAGPSQFRPGYRDCDPTPWFPPDPCERIAVLMPISSPRSLTRAPPEFPGLMEHRLDKIFIVFDTEVGSTLGAHDPRGYCFATPKGHQLPRLCRPLAFWMSHQWFAGRSDASIFRTAISVLGSVPDDASFILVLVRGGDSNFSVAPSTTGCGEDITIRADDHARTEALLAIVRGALKWCPE